LSDIPPSTETYVAPLARFTVPLNLRDSLLAILRPLGKTP
jgi:hypothetical protein